MIQRMIKNDRVNGGKILSEDFPKEIIVSAKYNVVFTKELTGNIVAQTTNGCCNLTLRTKVSL